MNSVSRAMTALLLILTLLEDSDTIETNSLINLTIDVQTKTKGKRWLSRDSLYLDASLGRKGRNCHFEDKIDMKQA